MNDWQVAKNNLFPKVKFLFIDEVAGVHLTLLQKSKGLFQQ